MLFLTIILKSMAAKKTVIDLLVQRELFKLYSQENKHCVSDNDITRVCFINSVGRITPQKYSNYWSLITF